ncbi:MAG: hypothetical protein IT450_15455 [Phycisphaerales bacterium]|nr:hypothetical protein [Phycisphaerales bacterium]
MGNHRLFIGLAALLPALFTITGCSQGVNWRKFAYDADDIAGDARGQLVFVYLRHWAVPACTRFEEDVLKNAAVLEQTKSMYCVVINFSADRDLAEGWGIGEPPGVVFMTSGGEVLRVVNGFKSAPELLEAIAEARALLANPAARRNATTTAP